MLHDNDNSSIISSNLPCTLSQSTLAFIEGTTGISSPNLIQPIWIYTCSIIVLT